MDLINGKKDSIKTLVVKVGTTLLTGPRGFDGTVLECLVKELAALKRERGMNILIVSSGAVGCGMAALGMKTRPRSLPLKQAVAAIGQARLMHYYEVLFDTYGNGLQTAQVLLTAADLDHRVTYLNVRNTIYALFEMKQVVPVVNENDSVGTEELRFGDNDTLAARVAAKIDADLLILLSDIDGLYDKNPRTQRDARLIPYVERITPEIMALAEGTAAQTSVGGMKTKLEAAKIACAAGVTMAIADGRRPNVIHGVLTQSCPMTLFGMAKNSLSQRKRWIAFGRVVRGAIRIDDGAVTALVRKGKSLLPAGVIDVEGVFDVGSAVHVTDKSGRPIARGLVNYNSEDIKKIKGCKSDQIQVILGHKDFDEIIHRDNLVLLDV